MYPELKAAILTLGNDIENILQCQPFLWLAEA